MLGKAYPPKKPISVNNVYTVSRKKEARCKPRPTPDYCTDSGFFMISIAAINFGK
jgi:hypothetical protein